MLKYLYVRKKIDILGLLKLKDPRDWEFSELAKDL